MENPAKINPEATEYTRGKDGLYACCDALAEPAPPKGLGMRWRRTKRPCTSPTMTTPAWDAYCAGEEVWEPYFVLVRTGA